MMDPAPRTTRARILEAFLHLAAQRGIDATPTRLVAQEAGVSELTLFRLFGDKATLIREAIRHAAPTVPLSAYEPAIDASTPEQAAAGLAQCLRFLRDQLVQRQELLHFAIAEGRHHPELRAELMEAPRHVGVLLEKALRQAAPQLRPGADERAVVLSLEGLLLLTVLWTSHGVLDLPQDEWDAVLEASVRAWIR